MIGTGGAARDAYLDIAPLFEVEWTGIQAVTAELARFARGDGERRWRFLYNNQEIAAGLADHLLFTRSGRWIEALLPPLMSQARLPGFDEASRAIALFPNVKPTRGLFFREAMIVHDLAALLTPQFHPASTIRHHAPRLPADLATSDVVFCVSRATADDLSAYFAVEQERLVVTPLGVRWPLPVRLKAQALLRTCAFEPFILVLGTLEPRKNVGLVLDHLLADPSILTSHTVVLAGRDGWLGERAALEAKAAGLGALADRVVFAGYLDEAVKLALLCTAHFSIFPSFFEGFGLPVAESLAAGCPVLCSNSSSLPEVADDSCVLFDPADRASFAAGLAALARRTGPRRPADPLALQVPERLQWSGFIDPIRRWLRSMDRHDP